MIRTFCKQERIFAVILVCIGLAAMTAGAYLLLNQLHAFSRTGIPLILMSIPVIVLGIRVLKRTRFVSHEGGNVDSAILQYAARGERFIESINKTRNAGALLLLIGIVGIIVACLVESLAYTAWTWIVITATAAMLSLAAYYHVFRLEIHLHELRKEVPDESNQ